jgi:tRNA(fMet)-specific endonuclease VapC
MHLLDTNILTALHNAHPKVLQAMAKVDDPIVATTIVTKAEMLRGRIEFLLKADQPEILLLAQTRYTETERLLQEIQIISFDSKAIEHFQTLSQQSKFRKVGRGDLLIASIALAHRAILVTRNVKDFDRIPNLKIVNWMN